MPPLPRPELLATAVALFDHHETTVPQIYHYYGLLGIYGLCRTAELQGDAALQDRCHQLLERFPDRIEHSRYNFPSYTIGGIPRAYQLMRGHMTDDTTRRLVCAYAEEMMTATRDHRGILAKPGRPDLVWIDVAMAATPYLLFAGLAFEHAPWIDEAVQQTVRMIDLFRNPQTGLLHQCEGFIAPGVMSTDHWGRGNGWGLLPLAELVDHLPENSPHRPAVEARFLALCNALLPHQTPEGFWRQDITLPWAYPESSGTALFLHGMGIGLRRGLLDEAVFGPVFERGIQGLLTYAIGPEHQVLWCCPGCLCPGEGAAKGTPQAYMMHKPPRLDDGHGFGPIMLALAEAAQRS